MSNCPQALEGECRMRPLLKTTVIRVSPCSVEIPPAPVVFNISPHARHGYFGEGGETDPPFLKGDRGIFAWPMDLPLRGTNANEGISRLRRRWILAMT